MGFVNRVDQDVAKYWYPNETMVAVLIFWMVDVVIQDASVLYRVNEDKGDDSLPLVAIWRHFVNVIFLKYSTEDRFS